MLKLAQEGSDNEKIGLLQSLLEDANRRKSELETENRSGREAPPRGRWVSHRSAAAFPQAGESASDGGAESGGGAAEVSAGAGSQHPRRESSHSPVLVLLSPALSCAFSGQTTLSRMTLPNRKILTFDPVATCATPPPAGRDVNCS